MRDFDITEMDDEELIDDEEWTLTKDLGLRRNRKNSYRKAISRRNRERDKGFQVVWANGRFFDNSKKTFNYNKLVADGYNEPELNKFKDTASHKHPRFRFVDCGYDNKTESYSSRKRLAASNDKLKDYYS